MSRLSARIGAIDPRALRDCCHTLDDPPVPTGRAPFPIDEVECLISGRNCRLIDVLAGMPVASDDFEGCRA